MKHCLNAMEARLTDLLQTGLDTGAGDSSLDFGQLAEQCEACGLHTGHALMEQLSNLLEERTHTLDKQDGPLIEAIFQTEHYVTLCRERWQEIEILRSWQERQQCQEQDREGGDSL